jgi:hypothetical protein
MTAHICITINAESATEAREEMAKLLGQTTYKIEYRVAQAEDDIGDVALASNPAPAGDLTTQPPSADTPEAPKRERGKPAPGRARRTKEEIAEDEAADAAGTPEEPKAAISTGEERIDPTTTEDATQDAADEAAEAETTKAAELTHDDVRAALKKYLDAYGTAAAMEDGPKVLKMLFGDTAAKVSDVPGDQDSLAKAIAGIDEMLGKNPFKREAQL